MPRSKADQKLINELEQKVADKAQETADLRADLRVQRQRREGLESQLNECKGLLHFNSTRLDAVRQSVITTVNVGYPRLAAMLEEVKDIPMSGSYGEPLKIWYPTLNQREEMNNEERFLSLILSQTGLSAS